MSLVRLGGQIGLSARVRICHAKEVTFLLRAISLIFTTLLSF
jgi:hypothetical protein